MPRNLDEARLVVRGGPGQRVALLSWEDFVGYLDELRCARRGVGTVAGQSRLAATRGGGRR